MKLRVVNGLMTLIAAAGCLVLGGLMLNEPPMNDPPGFWARLAVYLTRSTAETRPEHPFPELTLRCYRMAPEALRGRVRHAMEILGWEIVDERDDHVHALVRSRLFGFIDDVTVKLVDAACGTELHVRSASRIGKADLGANARHIVDLHDILARQVYPG